MDTGLLRRLVPAEIVVAASEVDILFMEDGGPLEWCSYMGKGLNQFVCLTWIVIGDVP